MKYMTVIASLWCVLFFGTGVFGADTPKRSPATRPAKSTVYLCSGAGSMKGCLEVLKTELKKSIDVAEAGDKVDVLFFRDEKAESCFGIKLQVVSPQTKKTAAAFIDKATAKGTSDPRVAIAAAGREKPGSILFLLDGLDEKVKPKDVAAAFEKLHKSDFDLVVNVILLEDDNTPADLIKALEGVCEKMQGSLKRLKKSDL